MKNKNFNEKKGLSLNIVNFDRKRKYKLKRKKVALAITSGILALIIAISSGMISKKIETDKQNKQIIEQFYDSEELERRVDSYLKISEELNNLNLNKYETNDNLFVQYGISDELKSPEQLNDMIQKFKESSNAFDKYNLIKNNNMMYTILTLKKQAELVNDYIYSTGYNVAFYDISKATKKMAAEVYGLDPNNITFRYNFNNGEIVHMDVKDPNTGYIKTYIIKNKISNGIEDKIIAGVRAMVATDNDLDTKDDDNNLYNKSRNQRIKDAMDISALYMDEVERNDLFDEDLNKDFNKKSTRMY